MMLTQADQTFKIKDTNYDEVQKILLGIKNDFSTSHNGISIRT